MPTFQQRHYRALAAEFQDILRCDGYDTQTVRRVVDRLAVAFRRDNHSFNTALFKSACEPGANVNARTAEGAQRRASR